MTIIELISTGIIIGAVGSFFFSGENPSSELSSGALKNDFLATSKSKDNYLIIENEQQNDKSKVQQSNSFDLSLITPKAKHRNEESLFKFDVRRATVDSGSSLYAAPEASSIEGPEVISKPNTDENTVSVFGNVGALTWQLPTSNRFYESIQLKLNGPDNTAIVKDFHNGAAVNIYESLADGYYNWQSVVTPTMDLNVRQQMIAVREAGDSVEEERLKQQFISEGRLLTREQARNNIQSGGFRVINGQMIDGNIAE